MKKRWLKFLLEIVVSGMLITGCSKEEKKKEKFQDGRCGKR